MIALRGDVDHEAVKVIAELQRAVQRGDGPLALSVCETIDRMTRDGTYCALVRIDWGDEDFEQARRKR